LACLAIGVFSAHHYTRWPCFNGLARAKRAAGRPTDLYDLADILEIRRQTGQ
jgi:hypothetical protein